jgi:hypothetical protein
MPATVNPGDLLLGIAAFDNSCSITTPSGWTLLADAPEFASGSPVCGVYGKVAAGSEGGTTVDFVTSAVQRGSVHIVRISSWAGSLRGVKIAATGESGATARAMSIKLDQDTTYDILWVQAVTKSSVTAWPSAGTNTPTGYTNETFTGTGEDSASGASVATCTKASTGVNSEYIDDPWLQTLGWWFLIGVMGVGSIPTPGGGSLVGGRMVA